MRRAERQRADAAGEKLVRRQRGDDSVENVHERLSALTAQPEELLR